ncbi:MAG TPA: DUF350 domain-containing protein [Desulfosporosinus sp.]|nr:DUF350 domain-containing protein [Desulfosporosinus sp.]
MSILLNLGLSALFGLLGIIILIVGYIIFDKLIPLNFSKELGNNNIAVAIVIAGILIAIAIIVSRVVAAA